jgi:hypothetical protein
MILGFFVLFLLLVLCVLKCPQQANSPLARTLHLPRVPPRMRMEASTRVQCNHNN